MHSCHTSQHCIYTYAISRSHPFIGIHPLHNYKVHKIFPMPIHLCYLRFNILCMVQPWLTHIGCIIIINIINMYRHGTFLHSNIHMVWGLLPGPIHGICHKQTLNCMGHTYTLTMTTLIGPCRRFAEFAHQLLSWTCCLIPFSRGLLITLYQHQQHIQLGPCHRWFVH